MRSRSGSPDAFAAGFLGYVQETGIQRRTANDVLLHSRSLDDHVRPYQQLCWSHRRRFPRIRKACAIILDCFGRPGSRETGQSHLSAISPLPFVASHPLVQTHCTEAVLEECIFMSWSSSTYCFTYDAIFVIGITCGILDSSERTWSATPSVNKSKPSHNFTPRISVTRQCVVKAPS